MAFQFSTTSRNAALDAIETAIGASAILKIRSGSAPANCGTTDSGTVLVTASLPSDWLAAASGGAKALSGTWQDTSADAAEPPSIARPPRQAPSGLQLRAGSTAHLEGGAKWP